MSQPNANQQSSVVGKKRSRQINQNIVDDDEFTNINSPQSKRSRTSKSKQNRQRLAKEDKITVKRLLKYKKYKIIKYCDDKESKDTNQFIHIYIYIYIYIYINFQITQFNIKVE